jgi:hypothetical protein
MKDPLRKLAANHQRGLHKKDLHPFCPLCHPERETQRAEAMTALTTLLFPKPCRYCGAILPKGHHITCGRDACVAKQVEKLEAKLQEKHNG